MQSFFRVQRGKDAIISYLIVTMTDAVNARNSAAKDEKVHKLLELFKGQPETFQLTSDIMYEYLDATIPDLKYVLRSNLKKIYTPGSAAMSLVLRAGIEKNAKVTFELIKESVAKICKESMKNN